MPAMNGNLFRCRVRNSSGQVFSSPAKLTVIAGYTWVPPSAPFGMVPAAQQNQDMYSAVYGTYTPPGILTGSLVGSNFSMGLTANSDIAPPPFYGMNDWNLFSVYFATPGVKAFSFGVQLLSGSYNSGAPGTNSIQLWSLDGMTVYDSDGLATMSVNLSTIFHLTVPAAGQYVLQSEYVRVVSVPGANVLFSAGYTLGAGDQIALVA